MNDGLAAHQVTAVELLHACCRRQRENSVGGWGAFNPESAAGAPVMAPYDDKGETD